MSKVLDTILNEHEGNHSDCDGDGDGDDINKNDNDNDNKSFNCFKVSSNTLVKVIEYCTHYTTVEEMIDIDHLSYHVDKTRVEMVKQEWYSNYIDSLALVVENNNDDNEENGNDGRNEQQEGDELKKLLLAANYFDIEPLLSLSTFALTELMAGMNAAEIRDFMQ